MAQWRELFRTIMFDIRANIMLADQAQPRYVREGLMADPMYETL